MVFQFGAECATCDSQVAIVADWRDVSIRKNSDICGKRRPVRSITSQFGANCATCDAQVAGPAHHRLVTTWQLAHSTARGGVRGVVPSWDDRVTDR